MNAFKIFRCGKLGDVCVNWTVEEIVNSCSGCETFGGCYGVAPKEVD